MPRGGKRSKRDVTLGVRRAKASLPGGGTANPRHALPPRLTVQLGLAEIQRPPLGPAHRALGLPGAAPQPAATLHLLQASPTAGRSGPVLTQGPDWDPVGHYPPPQALCLPDPSALIICLVSRAHLDPRELRQLRWTQLCLQAHRGRARSLERFGRLPCDS